MPSDRPTAEEVCRTIELMTSLADEDDDNMNLLYKMTHVREGVQCNVHDNWVKEFRRHQEYWENANKAPSDETKIHDMEYPGLTNKT